MTRRQFLHSSLAVTLAASVRAAVPARLPRILLRSSWQVVNIGDIAHSPGVLALIERHIPGAETILWASGNLSPEVAAMEQRRFPQLRIVKGTLDAQGKASNADLVDAVAGTDFLLHGSGPSLVAARDVAAFATHTGKPFGVYSITHGSFLSGNDKDTLSRARFVFFRDSVSLERARAEGVTWPIMEFGPDGAFAFDLRDEDRAVAFLRDRGLEEGRFLCCIPRLRYTPYWLIHGTSMTTEQRRRAARNDAMADWDHAPLREAITAVVRETPMKVLVCPEDGSQMAVGKEWILDRLPADVRAKTVWREEFWLPDEALSTYLRSAGLFGLEMHSPILCVGNGVPAIVCRFEEQTSKGIMWRDIGLGDWLFDLDREEGRAGVVAAVLDMARASIAARAKAADGRAFVKRRQHETMEVLRKHLPAPGAATPQIPGLARTLAVAQDRPDTRDLLAAYGRFARWIIPLQRPDGLWSVFVDEPSLTPDTAGSAGIAAALAIGARHGWVDAGARAAAARTLTSLQQHLTPDGFLGGVSQSNKGGGSPPARRLPQSLPDGDGADGATDRGTGMIPICERA